jgi:hypothetical protein
MAFIGIKFPAVFDKEVLAMRLESLIARRGDLNNCIVVDERGAKKGELVEMLAILGVKITDVIYFEDAASFLDLELLSHAIGGDKWGDLIFIDAESDDEFKISRSDIMLSLLFFFGRSAKLEELKVEYVLSVVKKMLGELGSSSGTSISEELRSILIGLENIFAFLDLRSCSSACLLGDSDQGLSRSILASASFAKKLEVSGSRSFPAVAGCIKHLQEGKAICSHFKFLPVSNIDYLYFKKTYVWIASLHLAHARFLSARVGYANSAVHHCVRAVELYLLAILVPAGKVFPKPNMSFWTEEKKIMGVGGLFSLSPVTVPQDVKDITELRNKSELAHGVYRWDVKISEKSLLAVEGFLLGLDITYSDGDLSRHLDHANSIDLSVVAMSWMKNFMKTLVSDINHVVL